MVGRIQCISPIDGNVYVEREQASSDEALDSLLRANKAFRAWRHVPLEERQTLLNRAVDIFVSKRDAIAEEITWQLGRPITQSPSEVAGFEERARHMIDIAPRHLMDQAVEPRQGFNRFIRHQPMGVVLVVAPWNYPYLTSVNAIIPALMAGNAVVLKHSAQTPLCAERYAEVFAEAGLPDDVFQFLHLDHDTTLGVIEEADVNFVAFTGSVEAGRMMQRAAADRFVRTALELGGKDPAYVRPDADLDFAIDNLVDGAFFNAGQSCCAIERIYVHADLYDRFVDGFVSKVGEYSLGDPLKPETSLGPMVKAAGADFVRAQVDEAVARGARSLVNPQDFPADRPGTPYCAPRVLVDVNHEMRVMTEESFGPVIGIMKVEDDDDAVQMMNDSRFGLTASVWTRDEKAALAIGDRVVTGTFFMNRCDYLDPALAWTGVKDSGRGCTLSELGYLQLTRPKSFHLRTGA